MGRGGGFTIGTEMQKNTLDGIEKTQASNTVGSVQGYNESVFGISV